MQKIITGTAVVCCLAIALASCASTKPVAAAIVETPKIEPKFIEVKVWKTLSTETAYPDGVLSALERFTYDGKGNLLKEELFNGTKALVSQKAYTYGNPGTVEILTSNAVGDLLGKAVRVVDGDRLLKESLFNAKGELQSTEEYAYDASGQKTRWSVKTSSGNQISSEYMWEAGLLKRISVLDAGAGLIKRFERIYGSDLLLSEEAEFDSAGTLLGKIVYIREGKYLVREEKQNEAGGVKSSFQYKNDADGNPVEIRYLDRGGRVIDVKTLSWQVFTHTVQVQ